MPDSRFFPLPAPLSLYQIAQVCDATIWPENTPDCRLHDVAPLHTAQQEHLTFYHNVKYVDQLRTTKATACLIHPDNVAQAPVGLILLITPKPYRSYAKVASLLYPDIAKNTAISPLAVVSPLAKIGKNVTISPFCVIHDHVEIGDDTFIDAHTIIHEGTTIGPRCRIFSHVTISHAIIGSNVYIKSGARIGQKGFGFEMDESGHISVPQLGRVLIGDHVEIGANTTIDRGAGPDTIIGRGTRIDNLVQIAHNVVVGDYCVLVAQTGIAGSTKLGKFVIIAGQAGIAGHLEVGDKVRIAAQSGVMKNIESGQTVAGYPAIPVRDWHRQTIALSKMTAHKEKNTASTQEITIPKSSVK